MNRIFKSITFFTVGIIIIIFSACVTDPGSYSFDKDNLLKNISSIELIYYDSSYEYVYSRDLVEPFDINKVSILKTLPEEKIQLFCESVSEIDFMICDDQLGYNSAACGTSILIRLSNENIIVMSDNHDYNDFVAEYNSDGQLVDMVLSFSNKGECQMLITSYFAE